MLTSGYNSQQGQSIGFGRLDKGLKTEVQTSEKKVVALERDPRDILIQGPREYTAQEGNSYRVVWIGEEWLEKGSVIGLRARKGKEVQKLEV